MYHRMRMYLLNIEYHYFQEATASGDPDRMYFIMRRFNMAIFRMERRVLRSVCFFLNHKWVPEEYPSTRDDLFRCTRCNSGS